MPDTRWGLTIPFAGVPLAEHEPLIRRAEAAGYDDLWSAETNGADGFTPLALSAVWTERVRLLTGVVNPYTRGPSLLAQSVAALADASRGRFALGLGSSSPAIVEAWNEIPFVKPLSKVRETVETLRPVLRGERGVGGFKLEAAPQHEIPIVIAALRARMLRLAAELGDGVFSNFLPVSGTAHVVEQVRSAEAAAGREPAEIACRFFCLPGPDDDAVALAKRMFTAYGTTPVYAAFFRELGWAERLDPMVEAWEAGDRKLALERCPEDLVREVFVFGDPDAMKERLAEFEAGGITSFTLALIVPPDRAPGLIDALAR
jgi:probable F420-dependent oxidoreductase